MSSRGAKRQASSPAHSASPTKRHYTANETADDFRETTPRQQNSSQIRSSPPETPKTPRGTSKLGLNKNTAKKLMKHGSKLGALYNMLYGFSRIILDKMLETEEEFKPCLEELAALLTGYFVVRGEDILYDLERGGAIDFAETQLLLGDVKILDSFKRQAKLLKETSLSGTEAGCRLNIGFYLANAVYLARKYLQAGDIGLFSEVPIEHEDLPGIGYIGGNLDYLTSTYVGAAKRTKASIILTTPYLLIVEAKTESTIGKDTSFYQLIAQLLTMEHRNPSDEGRWGCLTTGEQWNFYFLRKNIQKGSDGEDIIAGYDLFEQVNVSATGENGLARVMGILIHIVGQFRPSLSDTVKLERDVKLEEEDEESEWEGIVED